MPTRYRLVTRSDFDGLTCAVLLTELHLIDELLFVHPKDMQDAKIPVSHQDITTNLPYVPGVHLAFDHHSSEGIRLDQQIPSNYIFNPLAPSAARVVYQYYGGASAFRNFPLAMLEAVDLADSARFTLEDVLQPQDWVLLNFILDARTGLGRFNQFRLSNYQLMLQLINSCRHQLVGEILQSPDVQERVEFYQNNSEKFEEQLRRCAHVHGNVILLDLREEEIIYPGNRFLIYALFPHCNISIHVIWGLNRQNTVFAMGNSIFNRTNNKHLGQLCLEYGGGGHSSAGTCQIHNDRAELALLEILEKLH